MLEDISYRESKIWEMCCMIKNNIKIKRLNSHIEVYNKGNFLFSVDNDRELSEELETFYKII